MTPILRDELRLQSIRTEPGGPVVALAVYGPVRIDWLGGLTRFACAALDCEAGRLELLGRPSAALGSTMVFVARERLLEVDAMEWRDVR